MARAGAGSAEPGDLRTVAGKDAGGRRWLTYGVFASRPAAHERHHRHRRLPPQDRQPIAFNALPVMDVELDGKAADLLHLGLVMVDPERAARACRGCSTG